MAKKARRVITVPASLVEAGISLFRIGALDRSIAAIESDLEEKIARLRKQAVDKSAPMRVERDDLACGLELFADANREAILQKNRKSVKISAGVFGWRMTPIKVEIARGAAEKVLAAIKKLKLKQYIRTKESIDKEALRKDTPEITGVKYVKPHEEFFCKPAAETGTDPDTPPEAVTVVKSA